MNQRFGTEFKPADQLFFDQIREETAADIRAMVVIEDAAYARATGNCSAETDVTRMLLETLNEFI